ncbi:MAG: NAD(P)-dependent oxidoreductase [Bacteroidota bacterium]
MRIFITGANGLLGQKIVEKVVADRQHQLLATSKGENRNAVLNGYDYQSVDISNREEVLAAISGFKPEVIINTAAMTNVDQCEQDREGCQLANVTSVEYLIEAARSTNAHLIHLSTDFVFDGENGPYKEEDTAAPLSFYGNSKLLSEQLVEQSGLEKWSVARTIIVYGTGNRLSRGNIVFWVKEMLEEGKEITIVDDQFRAPTFAEDLAEGCLLIAEKGVNGIFHLSGPETLSIYELATRVARFYNLNADLIKPVQTGMFTQPAKRPLKTGFDISKARRVLGYAPKTLEESLGLIEVS